MPLLKFKAFYKSGPVRFASSLHPLPALGPLIFQCEWVGRMESSAALFFLFCWLVLVILVLLVHESELVLPYRVVVLFACVFGILLQFRKILDNLLSHESECILDVQPGQGAGPKITDIIVVMHLIYLIRLDLLLSLQVILVRQKYLNVLLVVHMFLKLPQPVLDILEAFFIRLIEHNKHSLHSLKVLLHHISKPLLPSCVIYLHFHIRSIVHLILYEVVNCLR